MSKHRFYPEIQKKKFICHNQNDMSDREKKIKFVNCGKTIYDLKEAARAYGILRKEKFK